MIKDMKSVVVFALSLTLWTISSPALAGLGDTCTLGTDCAAVAYATCDGSVCVCSGAYTNNTNNDGCVAKGLNDACAADTDCAAVAYATCDGSVCACSGAYKNNANNNACVAKGLNDTCAAETDCAGVNNSKCTSNTCSCDTKYVTSGVTCTTLLGSACSSNSSVCSVVSNATCTNSLCACVNGYVALGADCSKENGARGMTANIGLLCAILTMLSYVNTL